MNPLVRELRREPLLQRSSMRLTVAEPAQKRGRSLAWADCVFFRQTQKWQAVGMGITSIF